MVKYSFIIVIDSSFLDPGLKHSSQLDLAMISGIDVKSVILTIAIMGTIAYLIIRKKTFLHAAQNRQIIITGYAWRKSLR